MYTLRQQIQPLQDTDSVYRSHKQDKFSIFILCGSSRKTLNYCFKTKKIKQQPYSGSDTSANMFFLSDTVNLNRFITFVICSNLFTHFGSAHLHSNRLFIAFWGFPTEKLKIALWWTQCAMSTTCLKGVFFCFLFLTVINANIYRWANS